MNYLRIVPAAAIVYVAFFYSSKVLGVINLNDVMTPDEQKKTGVSQLSDTQKKELETWINQKFTLKTTDKAKQIYLSENIQSGSQLRLSDGSLYEVMPQDRPKASFWLTPFQVRMEPSNDPNYPVLITNTITMIGVRAKQLEPPNAPPS
jgi:hypothetical protein